MPLQPRHPRPTTLFAAPEWALLPDPEGPRPYANVDNRMEVIHAKGRAYEVALAVPTGWFTLARDHLAITPDEQVTLSIELLDHHYVFAALTNTDRLFDLWSYTQGKLPDWLREDAYILGAGATAYRQAHDHDD